MLEYSKDKMKAISTELQQDVEDQWKWFKEQEKNANEKIERYGKIRDNKDTLPTVRLLAAYITENECSNMVMLATQIRITNTLSRLALHSEYSITVIQKELIELKQPSAITPDDREKIKLLEKSSEKLKREISKMRPYVKQLKEGIENKQKWLNENR